MKNEGTKTGLVGFFDILGYQNLLERNEPEKIAEEVIPILTNIDKKVMNNLEEMYNQLALIRKKQIESTIKPDNQGALEANKLVNEIHKKIIKSIRWLIFSDTVLLTMPINNKDQYLVEISWTIFLIATILLQTNLFKAGLPTRGAIDYGKFFVKDACFAGRPIVNSYQLCSQLEIASCILSEVAADEFRKMDTRSKIKLYDTLVMEYLIPMKSGERHLLTVIAHTYDMDSPDIHNSVMHAFWGNKKDIPISVRQKAQNTEQWLEFLRYRQEQDEKKKLTAES